MYLYGIAEKECNRGRPLRTLFGRSKEQRQLLVHMSEDLLAAELDAQAYACDGIIWGIGYSYADSNSAKGWHRVFTRPDRTRPHYPGSSTMMTP